MARAPSAGAVWRQKRLGGLALALYRAPAAPLPRPAPRAPTRGLPSAPRVSRPLARLPAGRGARQAAPGCGGGGYGPRGEYGVRAWRLLLAGVSSLPHTPMWGTDWLTLHFMNGETEAQELKSLSKVARPKTTRFYSVHLFTIS